MQRFLSLVVVALGLCAFAAHGAERLAERGTFDFESGGHKT